MKRIVLLTLTAALLTSCEKPTGPTPHAQPAFWMTAATGTTFSGDATVLRATVLGLPQIVVGEAGPLPETGGAMESTLLSVGPDQSGGLLAAEVVDAEVVGQGNSSSAEATVASVSLTVAKNSIQADLLRSQAEATCDGSGTASASGSSEVVGLVINGQPITVSGKPNQTVNLQFLTVVINEQSGSASGNQAAITVSALHVTALDPLGGPPLADVVISSSHADITCGACTPPLGDFVTGGGWITGSPSGARANFGVAGGIKNGGMWGHLTYIDHGTGLKVKGTGVTGYEVTGPVSRRIRGTAQLSDGSSVTYEVNVTDSGEPGRNDTFTIALSNGYYASGNLAGGNIKLHGEPSPCF